MSGLWGSPTGEDHCEGTFAITENLSASWSSVLSLIFVWAGMFACKKALEDQPREDYRFPVLYGSFAFVALWSCVSHATLNYSMERLDEAAFNAMVLLLVYLTWEDTMLLMFYQIHVLSTTMLTLAYPYLFHVHLVPVSMALAYRLFCVTQQRGMLTRGGGATLTIALIVACYAACLAFWVVERMHCDPQSSSYMPSWHSLCQFFGMSSLYLSIVILNLCMAEDPNSSNRMTCFLRWCPIPHLRRKVKADV